MPNSTPMPTSQIISLTEIKPNPHNPRRIITGLMVDNMAASLKAVGLKNPIKVTTLPDGGYQVLSGHIRLAGARKAGFDTIPATILTLTPEQALLEAILDNQGQPMSWLETYMAAESLLNMPSKPTQQSIADQLGLDKGNLSKGLKLLGLLTPQARETLVVNYNNPPDAYHIPESVVRRLGDLGDAHQLEEALQVAIDRKMTEPQAKGLVNLLKAGNPVEAYNAQPTPQAPRAPKTQTASPTTASVPPASSKTATTPMGETETLAWDAAAGISVMSRIKTKIKKGERPSLLEALLLAGHYLGRVLMWINKNGFKLIGHILKFVWKLSWDALKSAAQMFGETFYKVARLVVILAILGGMAWLGWDIYTHGPLHPIRLIAAKVMPTRVHAEIPITTPVPTMIPQAPPAVTDMPKPMTEANPVSPVKETAPVSKKENTVASAPTAAPSLTQPTAVVKKTDVAGDILTQAAPAGVDVAKKLFGL